MRTCIGSMIRVGTARYQVNSRRRCTTLHSPYHAWQRPMGSTGPSHKRQSIFAYLRRIQKMVCDRVWSGPLRQRILLECVPYAGLSQTQVQV